jgi:hypothetical protein
MFPNPKAVSFEEVHAVDARSIENRVKGDVA